MKNKSVSIFLSLVVILFSSEVRADFTGAVTPTSLTYHFVSAHLTKTDQTTAAISTTSFDHTFTKTQADFAATKVDDVAVPFGRYVAVSICFANTVDTKFDGVVYHGPNGTSINNGDTIYTANTNGDLAGSVTTTNPGTSLNASHAIGANSQNCSSTYFKRPLCVSDQSADICSPNDVIFSEKGKILKTSENEEGTLQADVTLELHLLVDLFNSVVIDGDIGRINQVPNVQVTIGQPGAAIHLSNSSSSEQSEMSILLSSEKTILSVDAFRFPLSASTGMCWGSSSVNVSAVPSTSAQAVGVTLVAAAQATGTGTLQSTTAHACTNPDECVSHGINVTTGFLNTIGSSATVSCIPDSSATPPYLGYTYTGGAGQSGTSTLPIARIIDPSNLLSICPSADSHAVAGHRGTCSAFNTSSHGYQ